MPGMCLGLIPLGLVLLESHTIQGEIFTNPILLRQALLAEGEIAVVLKSVVKSSPDALTDEIESFWAKQLIVETDLGQPLSAFAAHTLEDDQLYFVASNPLHAFRLIKRLVEDVPRVKAKLLDSGDYSASRAAIELIESHQSEAYWPNPELDLRGIMGSFLRIQHTYNLPVLDLAHGWLQDRKYKAELLAEDCDDIAEFALEGSFSSNIGATREYALAIEWMEGALRLSVILEGAEAPSSVKRFARLEELKRLHDQHFQGLKEDQSGEPLYPNSEFFLSKFGPHSHVTTSELRQREIRLFTRLRPVAPGKKHYHIRYFNYLCNGLSLNFAHPLAHESCLLDHKDDPYLLLAPLKVEVISRNPLIHQIHEVFSQLDLERIKLAAQSTFVRSAVLTANHEREAKTLVSTDRTQISGWIFDSWHIPIAQRVSRMLNHVTGLQVSRTEDFPVSEDVPLQSESLQVGLYGPGGLYYPHLDTLSTNQTYVQSSLNKKTRFWVGNRIATAMIYLSDHLIGGATVFPNVGVALRPEAGSVAFWYNLHSNGVVDERSLHGACPIIAGVKWVANRWVREGSQVFKKPCLPLESDPR